MVGKLICEQMTPAAIETVIAIRREIKKRQQEADQLRCKAIEKAQFEADWKPPTKIINFAALEYISPKGRDDQGTIKFQIRAAVKLREDCFLRAGYSANADIVLERANQVLAIN
ncbi:MAG: hypothetical protein P8Y45_11570 [Exilibacterium sp.]